jgi:hypothetical protein
MMETKKGQDAAPACLRCDKLELKGKFRRDQRLSEFGGESQDTSRLGCRDRVSVAVINLGDNGEDSEDVGA